MELDVLIKFWAEGPATYCEKRIALLNILSEKKISFSIKDIKDNNDHTAGTLVELTIPL
ncbi:MAG: hypothetical protein HYR66_19350 [Sphingobacteriales bacterium]|nr:hypothetical protein [Sphingobacteriales bacterium]MBI3718877.1 hypothetical protein [Sphingobacteriales bacterium]